MECNVCDDTFDPEETGTTGLCGPCYDEENLAPGEPWPEGVRSVDLPEEWTDYFTSQAYDWPPIHCGRVVRIRFTDMTSGECVTCGILTG